MFEVCLLGTGGMMPLPYRWLTSCMMRYNGHNLLIDCGEGTQIAIKEKGWTFKPIDVILITHFHADHISGLPGLLLMIGNSGRTEPLTIAGPKGIGRVVGALRTIAPELPFEVEITEIAECEALDLAGFHIQPFKAQHRVPCLGYTVSIPRTGRFDAERAKAAGIPLKYWNPLQKGQTITEDGVTYTPDMVLGPDRKGLKVLYCTDTRPVPAIAECGSKADLMILEGMYGEPDKLANAKEHRHMMMQEAARLAVQAQPAELWLTHFSPSMNWPEQFMDEIRGIFPAAKAGKDGMSVDLCFEEEEA